jgi:adenylyltransferase/sulfurtransferase
MLPGFGMPGQVRLKNATAVIVGMGGLGCPVATYLAAAGVGHLVLIDDDRVDLTNLHRQVLYTPADVGRLKVDSAAERLSRFEPNLRLTTFPRRVEPGVSSDPDRADSARDWFADTLRTADVVIDGSDNFPTRYAVNAAAVAARTPLSYGSVYRYTGEVSTFLVGDGPCYACLHPSPPPPGTAPSCAEGGVLGVLPGIVGTLQATEALKLLAGLGQSLSGRLLSVDVRRAPSFREWSFQRRPDCHVCGSGPSPASAAEEAKPGAPEVGLVEFRQSLAGQGYTLVDIRSPEELAFGSLRGAIHRHGPTLESYLSQGPQPTVFACKSGARSGALVTRLRAGGWRQALSLAGSWKEWAAVEGETLIPY